MASWPQVQSAELGTVGSATGTEDVDGASWTMVPGRRSEVGLGAARSAT